MHLEDLYPLQGFQIERIKVESAKRVRISASSQSTSAICPYCGTCSARKHSRYQRKPQARPCARRQVTLLLTVQRYFCDDPECRYRTFVERVPDTVAHYARRTTWLNELLEYMAFEMSAEAVSRVAARGQVQISPDTVLRMVRSARLPDCGSVRVLGVDDWAFKRGQNYGAILVDLERGRAIDLLPDRSQDTFKAWLQEHPGVEVVSRDRSFEFKAAIEAAAPNARQVVDRWHLLHNLKERLQDVLPKVLKPADASQTARQTPTYAKRKKYFELVNYLVGKGYSQRLIARVLGLSRGTVRRYIGEERVPDWHPKAYRPSQLDRYESYLRKRWDSGVRDTTTLWQELRARGYAGQRQSVYRFLKRFSKPRLTLSYQQIVWLFMKHTDALEDQERADLETILKTSAAAAKTYRLCQQFLQLFDQRSSEGFDEWLEDAAQSELAKLRNFASGLRQDYAAVKAAFDSDWSNGQVEGQVNRLKTIKRQMYGRAKFDLLRARVLGPP